MTSLEEALAAIRSRARPLPAEEVPLAEAYGRVLAEAVRARRDQPATDISMMDGYALRASEAGGPLRVAGEIAAGDPPWSRSLSRGEAARIFTGAPLPPGADCVVMQEHAVREGATVRVQQPAKSGQHIRRRGEELAAGAEALPPGRVLDAADLALAAACGVGSRAGQAGPLRNRIRRADRLRSAGKPRCGDTGFRAVRAARHPAALRGPEARSAPGAGAFARHALARQGAHLLPPGFAQRGRVTTDLLAGRSAEQHADRFLVGRERGGGGTAGRGPDRRWRGDRRACRRAARLSWPCSAYTRRERARCGRFAVVDDARLGATAA